MGSFPALTLIESEAFADAVEVTVDASFPVLKVPWRQPKQGATGGV